MATERTDAASWGEITLKRHTDGAGGVETIVEVVEAPHRSWISLHALAANIGSVHGLDRLVLGTDGLGLGRVAYLVDGWDAERQMLTLKRGRLPGWSSDFLARPTVRADTKEG